MWVKIEIRVNQKCAKIVEISCHFRHFCNRHCSKLSNNMKRSTQLNALSRFSHFLVALDNFSKKKTETFHSSQLLFKQSWKSSIHFHFHEHLNVFSMSQFSLVSIPPHPLFYARVQNCVWNKKFPDAEHHFVVISLHSILHSHLFLCFSAASGASNWRWRLAFVCAYVLCIWLRFFTSSHFKFFIYCSMCELCIYGLFQWVSFRSLLLFLFLFFSTSLFSSIGISFHVNRRC